MRANSPSYGNSAMSRPMGKSAMQDSQKYEVSFAEKLQMMSQLYLTPQPNPYCFLDSLTGRKPCVFDCVNNIKVNASYNRGASTTNAVRWNT